MNVGLSQSYFEIFGLSEDFTVDTQQLAERYRELQKAVHPDRFADASDRDRRLAVQQVAQINEAYHTLKSPLKRARYLLEQKGVTFDDQRETAFDPDFLMEQMTLRESLAEVREQADPFTSVANLMIDINARLNTMLSELATTLAKDDLDIAKQLVHKTQFLDKLKTECENLEQDLAESI